MAFIDLKGERFNRLTVIGIAGQDKHHRYIWHCACDCGNEVDVSSNNLRTGNTNSCGCWMRDKTSEATTKNITDEKFGRLTAIKISGKSSDGSNIWTCNCDCGNTVDVAIFNLSTGHTQSCGCLKSEIASEVASRMGKLWVGEKAHNWRGGASFYPYCPKFNEAKKEEIREKYDRKCAYCGRPEAENITKSGKHKKLSVHHVDRDKEQGCNGKHWQLVPVCMHCHSHPKVI